MATIRRQDRHLRALHTYVGLPRKCGNPYIVNARELKRRRLARAGATFKSHRGGSGHLTVRLGDRTSQLPMHDARKEPGTGLVNKILKDLGLR